MSKRIFEIRGRRKLYAYLFQDPASFNTRGIERFDGIPKATDWNAPPLYVQNPSRESWDIGNFLGVDGLIVTSQTCEALSVFLKSKTVQLLPVHHAGNLYFAVNVLILSSIAASSAGSVDWPRVWSQLPQSPFKVKGVSALPLVAEDDACPGKGFRERVLELGLRGVDFHTIWEA